MQNQEEKKTSIKEVLKEQQDKIKSVKNTEEVIDAATDKIIDADTDFANQLKEFKKEVNESLKSRDLKITKVVEDYVRSDEFLSKLGEALESKEDKQRQEIKTMIEAIDKDIFKSLDSKE